MKPVLGITMGDPSGNGPEISIKCLMKPETYERCRPVVIGDAKCIGSTSDSRRCTEHETSCDS